MADHGIGGCVAYAFARDVPERTRSVTVLGGPIPGVGPDPGALGRGRISGADLPGGVGYLRLTSFDEYSAADTP